MDHNLSRIKLYIHVMVQCILGEMGIIVQLGPYQSQELQELIFYGTSTFLSGPVFTPYTVFATILLRNFSSLYNKTSPRMHG